METERIDCLCDLFEEHGILATREQAETIARDFAYHLDMEREMQSYQFAGGESHEVKLLKQRISELEKERNQAIDSFKKNVSRRNGWPLHEIWIGDNGEAGNINKR